MKEICAADEAGCYEEYVSLSSQNMEREES